MANNTRFSSDDAGERYERTIVPTNIKPHTEAVFDRVFLHEGERLLDAACGTGIVSAQSLVAPGPCESSGIDLRRPMPASM